MKKLFFVMAAVAALLTSCSKDDTFGGPTRGKVTFEVSTPELATRAYGDGQTADNLYYAVYDVIENAMVKTNYGTTNDTTDDVKIGDDLKATVTIDLVEGRQYEVAFWAESPESPYVFKPGEKKVCYNQIDNLTANNENYDAFFAYVPKDKVKVGQVVNVDLKRPFAQLNIATNDAAKAETLGVEVENTAVTVAGVYTSFNLATGEVQGQPATVTFASAPQIPANETIEGLTGYDLLSTNYVLVNSEKLVDVTFNFSDTKGKTDYVRTYSDVHVQRNYRTNIIGAILTDPTKFYVEIKPGVDGTYTEERGNSRVVSNAQSLQEAINDPDVDVIVFDSNINLNDLTSTTIYDNSAALSTTTRAGETSYGLLIPAGKIITLDLNGFTISQEKAQAAAYNMIQNQGTLTIMDSSANGGGKISYKDAGNGGNYVSNTIQNSGTLTIEAGTIENNSVENVATNGYPHPIDNSGKLIINGGTIKNDANYSSMRIWCTTDDDTEVTINGGTFYGSIDFQTVNSSANKGTLTINGGEFNADNYTKAAVRLLGFGTDVDEMNGYINGGEFNGVIKLGKYVDGEFNSQVFHISGGTFSDASVFNFLSDSAEEINITMAADMTLAGGTSLNYGGENLKKLTINGDNHKLTYKDSYRTYINLANANATLVLNDMQLFRETTGGTHWHDNNMKFENNTEMNDVTFNKGITLDDAKTFKLNNVNITKNAVSTYAMFITAGCDVTIDGMTINHADGVNGRGIKIVDEDVDNKDVQTKLNISNAKFTTAAKAAVLVLSKGGAVINWGEGNDISNVTEDKVWAVWIDEDAATEYNYDNSLVIVNGALVRVEGEIPTEITTDSAEAMAGAIAAGVPNINLTGDVTYGTAISNDTTIDLGGNTFEATGTINLGNNADLTMTGGDYKVNGTYGHIDVRPSSAEGSELLFEGVDFSFNKMGPSYGPSTNRLGSVVEVCATATDAHTKIKFKDCTFENAQVLFEGMSGKTGTFEAVFENCTFNALTSSAPVYVQNYVGGTITMTGCTFNLECTSSTASAISISPSTSTSVTLNASNNTLNAVAATPYTYDASQGETEVHNVKVYGTPNNIKFVSAHSNTTLNVTGTTVTGIAVNE